MLLRVEGATKRFPGVIALRDVSFDVAHGEVHVLFGENGAGKSTLVNLLAGTYAPDEGTIHLEGERLALRSPADARALGINAVFQEFSLIPTLSVAANIMLGRERRRRGTLDSRWVDSEARRVLEGLGFDIDLRRRVDRLPRGQQQMVEIAKALQGEPRLLILDEPTASLSEREAEVLFELFDRLKREQVGLVYITHRMQEIHRIADRVTVLRDGAHIATVPAQEVTEDRLVTLMTGRSLSTLYPTIGHRPERELLALQDASFGSSVSRATLAVHAGEVVGVAGLVGSGKSELAEGCFGLHRLATGELRLNGQVVRRPSPKRMLEGGLVYLPADRRREGLVLTRPLRENVSLSAVATRDLRRGPLINRTREHARVREVVERLVIRPFVLERRVGLYSGGNQQKAMLARGLMREPKVVVMNEPTTGVDVGARSDVYEHIRLLCERGAAVLLVSSDLPEILHLCHRAYVMHGGVIRAHLSGDSLTEEAVLANFFDA